MLFLLMCDLHIRKGDRLQSSHSLKKSLQITFFSKHIVNLKKLELVLPTFELYYLLRVLHNRLMRYSVILGSRIFYIICF